MREAGVTVEVVGRIHCISKQESENTSLREPGCKQAGKRAGETRTYIIRDNWSPNKKSRSDPSETSRPTLTGPSNDVLTPAIAMLTGTQIASVDTVERSVDTVGSVKFHVARMRTTGRSPAAHDCYDG